MTASTVDANALLDVISVGARFLRQELNARTEDLAQADKLVDLRDEKIVTLESRIAVLIKRADEAEKRSRELLAERDALRVEADQRMDDLNRLDRIDANVAKIRAVALEGWLQAKSKSEQSAWDRVVKFMDTINDHEVSG